MFLCLLREETNIKERLTRLKKVEKYVCVAFTDILIFGGNNSQQIISLLIETNDLNIILRTESTRNTLGKFLSQFY